MDPKLIKENAEIISAIASRWDRTGELSALDSSYLTAKIEELYGAVKGADDERAQALDTVPAAEEKSGVEIDISNFAIDIEPEHKAEPAIVEEPAPSTTEEEPSEVNGEVAPEPAPEAEEEKSSEPVAEEKEEEATEPAVAEADESPESEMDIEQAADGSPEEEDKTGGESAGMAQGRRGKADRHTIRALYDDEPAVEFLGAEEGAPEAAAAEISVVEETSITEKSVVTVEETVAENAAPAEPENRAESHQFSEHRTVLGDVINNGTTTLAESIAHNGGENSKRVNKVVVSIRSALDINDRYLVINELFGGDASAFDAAVTRLDGFANLNDAMLWIYDNYDWDPENAGTKLLVDIVVRKLS